MGLKDYFENRQGTGVLATSDSEGKVDAAYLFIEAGSGYSGKILFLTMTREKKDGELADKLKRRWLTPEEDRAQGPKFLVVFKMDTELPLLIGAGT